MEKSPKREMIGTEGKVLLDTLRRLHRKKAVENCIRLVKKTHPADLAWVFRYLNSPEQHDIFQIIAQTEIVADFLSELDESIMVELVDGLSPRFLAKVVGLGKDDGATPGISSDFCELVHAGNGTCGVWIRWRLGRRAAGGTYRHQHTGGRRYAW